jgi:hypothetical protein
MVAYKGLYNKGRWSVSEIMDCIEATNRLVAVVGALMREKIIQQDDPLTWGTDIILLAELYSSAIQVYRLFDSVTEENYDDESRVIKVTSSDKTVLKAFSDNITLCQTELEKGFFIFISPDKYAYN